MSLDLKISKSQCRDEKSILDAIFQGYIDFESAPWPSTSASAKDLIKRMLMKDPKKGITACAKNVNLIKSSIIYCIPTIVCKFFVFFH